MFEGELNLWRAWRDDVVDFLIRNVGCSNPAGYLGEQGHARELNDDEEVGCAR